MKLLTFRPKGQVNEPYRLGASTSQGILDVQAAGQALEMDLPLAPGAFYRAGLQALPALQQLVQRAFSLHALAWPGSAAWILKESAIDIGPCVPEPGKLLCVGLNYRKHAREAKLDIPPVPVLFSKFQNAIAASGEDIPLVPGSTRYDYEAELAVVIGKRAKYVPEDQALQYVLGYCNANDVSARELQGLTSQWLVGKTLDKFLPIGPYLLTADEAPDPQVWPVRCWLNGELRQDSSTADMIFSAAQIVSFASQYMTLEPGDLISTGTPEGVILGMKERVWMKAGDSMVVEVGPLGKLENRLVTDPSVPAGGKPR
jgi:2-keto-4-pentenoate hydratase/2-oxohepta-3-ene-1,7-dioic acid hydratase in catechol pathway